MQFFAACRQVFAVESRLSVSRFPSLRIKRCLSPLETMVGALAFVQSAILDNLTITIVLVSLLRKLVSDRNDRLRFLGLVVFAANTGGAWTVIGDVTTTMLWIKHRISSIEVMQALLIPSLICLTVGVLGLVSVPAFKSWTHLPPTWESNTQSLALRSARCCTIAVVSARRSLCLQKNFLRHLRAFLREPWSRRRLARNAVAHGTARAITNRSSQSFQKESFTMPDVVVHATTHPATESTGSCLRRMIADAAHLLPAQGPIEVFVHHNTLHALEHLPFHEAVRQGWEIYGAEPYLSERHFRELLTEGRITRDDIDAVLAEDDESQQEGVFGLYPELGDRATLRREMMRHENYRGDVAQLHWVIAETDALEKFRTDIDPEVRTRSLGGATDADFSDTGTTPHAKYLHGLWNACLQGASQSTFRHDRRSHHSLRQRDRLLSETGVDTDLMVAEVLVRFTAAFLDQGYASRQVPNRELGFFRCFTLLYQKPTAIGLPWLDHVAETLGQIESSGMSALDSITQSFASQGIGPDDRERFITQSLLALPGWSGMVHQMEDAPGWVNHPAPHGTLEEFLAIRLILDDAACRFVASENGIELETPSCREEHRKVHREDRRTNESESFADQDLQVAFDLFQWSQLMGWSPSMLRSLTSFDTLIEEIESFDSIARRRLFQEAYERHYQYGILDAIGSRSGVNENSRDDISFQICCCIDDREESFRRHLEEVDPKCETFGAAGFFAVAMNYKGVTEARYKPLCPAVITPTHYVRENVGYTFTGDHRRRSEARKTLGRLTHQVHTGSRSFFGGVVTSVLGSLAAFPLVARVLFPRLTSRLRQRAGRFLGPPPVTQLQLQRHKEPPGGHDGQIGYTLDEMTAIVRRLLEDIGLTTEFSPLMVMTGHGSSSINNPHMSAYNCGACAGKRGGPNARAFAQMANDFRVRRQLSELGIVIPDSTWFLGAYHNTCDESVVWYDLDRLPPTHFQVFETTKATVDEAILRNAKERCRRFEAAPIDITPIEALRHVERRSEDLSQVRPEYNHATDALCFVGRRAWSRNLFLDRRAFLTSYDPSIDDADGTILARILAAAIPVCAGINLEYYFSAVDNAKYGSGSKLPHNLVSLLGVMEGASSDLRTGLYQQMIEIHEPMRLMFVIEATANIMTHIISDNEAIERLCVGQWVRLAIVDPDTGELSIFSGGEFVPYTPGDEPMTQVAVSSDWFSGHRGNLPPAVVTAS